MHTLFNSLMPPLRCPSKMAKPQPLLKPLPTHYTWACLTDECDCEKYEPPLNLWPLTSNGSFAAISWSYYNFLVSQSPSLVKNPSPFSSNLHDHPQPSDSQLMPCSYFPEQIKTVKRELPEAPKLWASLNLCWVLFPLYSSQGWSVSVQLKPTLPLSTGCLPPPPHVHQSSSGHFSPIHSFLPLLMDHSHD